MVIWWCQILSRRSRCQIFSANKICWKLVGYAICLNIGWHQSSRKLNTVCTSRTVTWKTLFLHHQFAKKINSFLPVLYCNFPCSSKRRASVFGHSCCCIYLLLPFIWDMPVVLLNTFCVLFVHILCALCIFCHYCCCIYLLLFYILYMIVEYSLCVLCIFGH